jgi:hypothetical protein
LPRRSRRTWSALWLLSLSLAAGCGDQPRPTATPSATAEAEDCVGAAALVNGCPEPDRADTGSADDAVPCAPADPVGLVKACAFGSADGEPFALLGDSHARALRSAFAALGRRGYQLAFNGCPFVRDGRSLPEPAFGRCARFKREVPKWLAEHPEVKTVFVIGLPRNAATQDPANWTAAWETLPGSVERLVVIRDTPELAADTQACVDGATARPGSTCAVPRATALAPDPAIEAARRVGAQTIDLTRSFCDDTRCFPVVGGLLAYLDNTHVRPAFARSIGPFLAEDVSRLR